MGDMIPPFTSDRQMIRYRVPRRVLVDFLWAASTLRPRSVARDAQVAMTGVCPEPEILGGEHIPPCGPCLVACNHYSRPGFAAWWITLPIAAAVAAGRRATPLTQRASQRPMRTSMCSATESSTPCKGDPIRI